MADNSGVRLATRFMLRLASALLSDRFGYDTYSLDNDWVGQVLKEASAEVSAPVLPSVDTQASVGLFNRALEDVSVLVDEEGLPADADDITASVDLLPSLDPLALDFVPSTLTSEPPSREVCNSTTCADMAVVSDRPGVDDGVDASADPMGPPCPVAREVDAVSTAASAEPASVTSCTEGPRSIRNASPGQLVWLKNMEDCRSDGVVGTLVLYQRSKRRQRVRLEG